MLLPMNGDVVSPIIREITPLDDKDCFYMVRRCKSGFDYPIHAHDEYEINLLCDAAGARRVVGDSSEAIDDLDLVFIAGRNLEHTWEQYRCESPVITETTIQFSPSLLSGELVRKESFAAIDQMFEKARNGLAFPSSCTKCLLPYFDALLESTGFEAFILFLRLLNQMAGFVDQAHVLSSSVFAKAELLSESRRVRKVQQYVAAHYKEEIRLQQMADLTGMTATAFSRFFRLRTGKTFSDYLIETRIGAASRYLVDTSMAVSEICYESGFNNISNFNRIFRKKKGCSPKTFREHYTKNKHQL